MLDKLEDSPDSQEGPRMRITQTDVARMAGVSRQTVSLVVNDDPRVAPSSRQAVLKAIEKSGYRVNATARSLATASSGVIGMLLPNLNNPFYAVLAQQTREACDAERLGLFIATSDSAREKSAIERFLDFGVDGLLLVSPRHKAHELAALTRGTPAVILTASSAPAGIDLVRADDEGGSALVTGDLMDEGYAPVIHICTDIDMESETAALRQAGYASVAASRGQDVLTYVVSDRDIVTTVTDIIARYGTGFGIVAHNDMTAFRVISVLLQAGLTIGEDVGVAGFDNTYLARFPGTELTSVDQEAEQLSKLAIRLILERREGRTDDVEIAVPTKLVKRASTSRGEAK